MWATIVSPNSCRVLRDLEHFYRNQENYFEEMNLVTKQSLTRTAGSVRTATCPWQDSNDRIIIRDHRKIQVSFCQKNSVNHFGFEMWLKVTSIE